MKTKFVQTLPLVCVLALLSACAAQPPATPTPQAAATANLGAVKTYLLEKTDALTGAVAVLKSHSDAYYEAARAANFDYAAVFSADKAGVVKRIEDARAAWMTASPLYEQMEGIVAGTPSLADFDVILDAGASQAEGGDGVVPFDLTLPDGRVLPKPGNLFGVNESTLWGTDPAFTAKGAFDFNADGTVTFGEALPDANVLKASVDALADYSGQLKTAAAAWTPTEQDAFNALVVMIPTMTEYFDSWKSSRFVSGEGSTQRDFVAISRLADIGGILGSLEVVRAGVSPRIASVDPAADAQIAKGLAELKAFVANVHAQEQAGKRFTPEEADTLGAEAQNRATAVTGLVAQVAGQLGVNVQQ
jgi:Imelysin